MKFIYYMYFVSFFKVTYKHLLYFIIKKLTLICYNYRQSFPNFIDSTNISNPCRSFLKNQKKKSENNYQSEPHIKTFYSLI
jgi:hypothetical protein